MNKLLSRIEDLAYANLSKEEADKLVKSAVRLFEEVNFSDYKLNVNKNLSITIKHKAYANKIKLMINKNNYYINDNLINLSDINSALPKFFIKNLTN